MKFIKFAATNFLLIVLAACGKRPAQDISELLPEYKLMVEFSKRIKPETDLILFCYGINECLADGYKIKNHTADFNVSYKLYKVRQDVVSIEDARRLVVSVAEGLLREINSNEEVSHRLDICPLNSNLIEVSLYFQDENQIELGQGVSTVFFYKGKIKYRRYEIEKYTGKYPAVGKHYTIHEETYAEALETVKKQGNLIPL